MPFLQEKRRAESRARVDKAKNAEMSMFTSPGATAARREVELAHSISQADHAAFLQALEEQNQLEKRMGGLEKWLRTASSTSQPLRYAESVSPAILNHIIDQITQQSFDVLPAHPSDIPIDHPLDLATPNVSVDLPPDLPIASPTRLISPATVPSPAPSSERDTDLEKIQPAASHNPPLYPMFCPRSQPQHRLHVEQKKEAQQQVQEQEPDFHYGRTKLQPLPVPTPQLQPQQPHHQQSNTHVLCVLWDEHGRASLGYYRGIYSVVSR